MNPISSTPPPVVPETNTQNRLPLASPFFRLSIKPIIFNSIRRNITQSESESSSLTDQKHILSGRYSNLSSPDEIAEKIRSRETPIPIKPNETDSEWAARLNEEGERSLRRAKRILGQEYRF